MLPTSAGTQGQGHLSRQAQEGRVLSIRANLTQAQAVDKKYPAHLSLWLIARRKCSDNTLNNKQNRI
ncbi:MAG: hypothetical protein AAFX01_01775 [Cyanobacteria bacterium J06638_28]